MSENSRICILKTKDQYRIAHLNLIDINILYYSIIDGDWRSAEDKKGLLVPSRVVLMWGRKECKYTRKEEAAYTIARKWQSSLWFCKYGIEVFSYNETWRDIILEASVYAKKEIEHIKRNGRKNMYNMKMLQKIADKKYG